jgi:hypothetical protein
VNTHLPDFTASAAGFAATTLPAGFAAALAGLFFSPVRAEAGGAAFARTGVDGFYFAAIFLGLAEALAMADRQSEGGRGIARLTPFWAGLRKPQGSGFWALHVEPSKETEADQAVDDQEYRDNQVEKPRHDQDQHTRDDRDDRRDMSDSKGH